MKDLIFVGYTNGNQILHASGERRGGEGSFYSSTEGDCYIPLYMLKAHAHRIGSTSVGNITLETVLSEHESGSEKWQENEK